MLLRIFQSRRRLLSKTGTIMTHLSFLMILLVVVRTTNAEPLFLFSGQSNMLGHSSDEQSVGGTATLQHYLFENFLKHPNVGELKQKLKKILIYKKMYDQDDVIENQTTLLMELYNKKIVGPHMAENHSSAKCFCRDPSGETKNHPDTPTPMAPFINCGASFGHELAFSHALSSHNPAWKNVPFTAAKVAVGGTEIYRDWYPGLGTYWEDLNRTIHSTPGNWYGFAWHQGENDCFTNKNRDDTTLTYLGNLTELVSKVRVELFQANKNNGGVHLFSDPSDIPVAIFELGFWPGGEFKDRVVSAQNAFVENDGKAVVIKSDDLNRFYHLDAVSLLITGSRLYDAWSPILPDPPPATADEEDGNGGDEDDKPDPPPATVGDEDDNHNDDNEVVSSKTSEDSLPTSTSPPENSPFDHDSTVEDALPHTSTDLNSFLPGFESRDAGDVSSRSRSHGVAFKKNSGIGFQSNMGPSFPGGMVYDSLEKSIYVTGSKYRMSGQYPSCFLGYMQVDPYQKAEYKGLSLKYTANACNSISQVGDNLYTVGMSLQYGKDGNEIYHQPGVISRFKRDRNDNDGHWNWVTDPVIRSQYQSTGAEIQFPTAVVANGEDSIFVASMVSADTSSVQSHWDKISVSNFPNLLKGDHLTSYDGSQFYIRVEHLHSSPVDPSMMVQTTIAEIKADSHNEELLLLSVAGMAVLDKTSLLVVGSTKGRVDPLGRNTANNDNVDGFIVRMSLEGKFDQKLGDTVRIDSIDHQDDWITNLCLGADDSFYIVGATMGNMPHPQSQMPDADSADAFVEKVNHDAGSVDAFVAKVKPSTVTNPMTQEDSWYLETIWTHQFHVQPGKGHDTGTSSAFGCSVVPDQDVLYVSGVVKDGATINYSGSQQTQISAGSDDIFVAQLNATDGSVRWLQQIGSSGNESLARDGGILVDTNAEGGAIVYGETTGNLYHKYWREGTRSDIFIVTLNKENGSYPPTIEESRLSRAILAIVAVFALVSLIILCCVASLYRKSQQQKMASMMFVEETAGLMAPID